MHSYQLQLHTVLGATGQGWEHAFPGHIPTSRRGSLSLPPASSPCSRVPYFSGSLGNPEPQVYTTPGFLFTLQLQFWRKYFWPFCLPGWAAEDRCKRSQYISAQKARARRTVCQVTRFHGSWKSWQFRHTQLQVSSAGMRELCLQSQDNGRN